MNNRNGRFTTILSRGSRCLAARFVVFAAAALLLALPLLWAQAAGTGSIVGVVTDPQGKGIADAKVDIRNRATGAVIHLRRAFLKVSGSIGFVR